MTSPFGDSFNSRHMGYAFRPIEYPTEILALAPGIKMPGGIILATGVRAVNVLPGHILARLTADVAGLGDSGQFVVCKSTQVKTQFNENAAAQTIELDDVSPFAVGDLLKVGDHDASAILAIDYDLNTVSVIVGTSGTSPITVDTRASVGASGQEDGVCIAADRFTQLPVASRGAEVGAISAYIAGTFKKAALRNLNTDMDTDLGGYDVVLAQETAYRIP